MSLPTTIEGIVQAASYEEVFHYLLVSTNSLLSTEYVVTLHSDIRFIWTSRLSLTNALYLLNRYVPPVNGLYSLYIFIFTEQTGERGRLRRTRFWWN